MILDNTKISNPPCSASCPKPPLRVDSAGIRLGLAVFAHIFHGEILFKIITYIVTPAPVALNHIYVTRPFASTTETRCLC